MSENPFLLLTCPHCSEEFIVLQSEINCKIFRHFVFKNFQLLNPHTRKEECDRVVAEDLGYGCAGPIRLELENDKWIAKIGSYDD